VVVVLRVMVVGIYVLFRALFSGVFRTSSSLFLRKR